MWILSLVDRAHTVVEVCSILQPRKQLWCSVVILCSKLAMLCLSNRAQCTDKIVDGAVVSILLLQLRVADCSVFKQVCCFYRLQDVFVMGASCEYLTALALWSIHSAVSRPHGLLLRYVASSVDVICDRTLWCSSWRTVFRAVIEQWRKTPGDEKLRMLKFRCCLSANRNTCTVLCLYCTSILHTYSLCCLSTTHHVFRLYVQIMHMHVHTCIYAYIHTCIHTYVHASRLWLACSWVLLPCLCRADSVLSAGRLKMLDLKMQDWKMTDNFARNHRVWKMQDWKMMDNISANSEQNYGVWKMQDWTTF